jgi:prepilin-type N-terminal cleavage/methylation domain-containing protein
MRTPARARLGFTMIELLMVVTITGLMVAISASRFRISEFTEVKLAGEQMAQDVDHARTRALSARSVSRVKFTNSTTPSYAGFLDTDGDSVIVESDAERQFLHGSGKRELPKRVIYGRGSAPAIPDDAAGGAITFADSRVEFNSRGVVKPLGTSGVIYMRHTVKPENVVAVQITAAGNVRLWTYQGGTWK